MDRGVWQALVVELQRVGHNRVSNTCVLAGVYPTDPGGGGQSLSRVQLFATPWTAARQASLSFTISQSLLKLMSNPLRPHGLQPARLRCP